MNLFAIGEILEEISMNGMKGYRHTLFVLKKVEGDS